MSHPGLHHTLAQSLLAYHIAPETGAQETGTQELAQCHVLGNLHITYFAYRMMIRGTSPCALKRFMNRFNGIHSRDIIQIAIDFLTSEQKFVNQLYLVSASCGFEGTIRVSLPWLITNLIVSCPSSRLAPMRPF